MRRSKLELRNITPGLAGEYLGQLEGSAPTKNQALAALRNFFDALVQRHAVALNPFASVRGIKYSVTEGRTAELGIEQAQKLFASIDTGNVVGLRDRAVLGVLAYTGARVGAVAKLRLSDYRNLGERRVLRFREKGGKEREIPVRHDLAAWLNEYMQAAGIDRGFQKQGSAVPRGRLQAQDADPCSLPPAPDAPDDETPAGGCRAAGSLLPAQLPRHRRHRSAQSERAARRRAVPGRALQPHHHAHVRSPPAQGHAEYC